jgi:glycosyltransferase involved in cell wall biosynthesis
MTFPEVSVIIPCFNAERFLQATLESVVAQETVAWECIIVDDGSQDQSSFIANQFTTNDARFRLVGQENRGRALALREGCRHIASGSKYLFFLDADDLLVPKALRTLSGYLDSHPEVAVAACHSQLIDKDGNAVPGCARSRWVPGSPLPRKLRRDECVTPFATFYCGTGQGPFALHRRSVFETTEGWDPRFSEFSLHEDTDIFCQMALRGEVHYLPETLYCTRKHGGNVSGHSPKVQTAYARFREKWDNYEAADASQQALIDSARRFYRGSFRPCRDLKVAVQSFRKFLSTGDAGAFRWGFRLLCEGSRDLVASRWREMVHPKSAWRGV